MTCIQVALDEGDSPCYMPAWDTLPSQSRYVMRVPDETAVPVAMATLRSLLEQLALPKVSLLKMDIEGSKHAVLIRAQKDVLTSFARVGLEYHRQGPKARLFDHIRGAGFHLRRDRSLGPDYGVAEFVREGS